MAIIEMTCQELVELITDYLEGMLPTEDAARFDAHIARCPHCTRYLAQIRQTITLTGRLAEEQIAPMAKDELLSAFRDWKRGRE